MRGLGQVVFPSRRWIANVAIGAPAVFALAFGVGDGDRLFAQTRTTEYRASPQPSARRQSAPVQHRLPPPNSAETIIPGISEPVPAADSLTLEDLQNLSLRNNPALAQAWQKVRAAEGQWLHAGLRPNPIFGYQASEVGNSGQSGQQGAFYSQEFVRRRKLERSRAAQSQEVARARQEYAAQRMRVLNDVRTEHSTCWLASG
jgi:outer membrane protein TolC